MAADLWVTPLDRKGQRSHESRLSRKAESGPMSPRRVGRAAALAWSRSPLLLLPALHHQCDFIILSDYNWEGLLSLCNQNLERKTWEKVKVLSPPRGAKSSTHSASWSALEPQTWVRDPILKEIREVCCPRRKPGWIRLSQHITCPWPGVGGPSPSGLH